MDNIQSVREEKKYDQFMLKEQDKGTISSFAKAINSISHSLSASSGMQSHAAATAEGEGQRIEGTNKNHKN